MEESQFDVIILGTGLVNSIVAAALSKAGYKVAHVDANPYYGGDEASLSLEELVQWGDNISALSSGRTSRFHRLARSSNVPSQSRHYSICLQPAVIPSVGPLISSLVASGVAKYSGFRLLESVSIYDSTGNVKNVPGSKEDIFKSKEISLIEKRRLMRFLTFAAGDFEDKKELQDKEDMPFLEFLPKAFSLSDEISSVIAYSLAFCMSSTEPTLSTLVRLRSYLRSGGRYGPSPFLLGHYGGLGDIAQGFCRAAAVNGAVYILSREVRKISHIEHSDNTKHSSVTGSQEAPHRFNYTIDLDDFPDTLSCKLIISPASYVPPTLRDGIFQLPPLISKDMTTDLAALARCVAIIDQPLLIRHTPTPEPNPSTDCQQASESQVEIPTGSIEQPIDTAIFVFPPSTVNKGSNTNPATVLINGEGSLSTPKGKWLLYINLPLASVPEESASPESLLRPYLEALLSFSGDPLKPIEPIFDMFYLETPETPVANKVEPPPTEGSSCSFSTYLIPAVLPIASLPNFPDQATLIAEATFKEAIKTLRKLNSVDEAIESPAVFWPPLPRDEADDDDNEW
ncbi:FAD/NAD(P)-binding domain-containing protein [Pholiota conissans]|uniref:FAD/NAD(P)-binding domain-containing protein n=1 Tax=Pholiota conissans TaxID=109636 RepID=A0A9P5ZBS4_9AGAR|nr:FAD/NAD(P)-binding domain-containing protein [Pholiota conissans]